MNDQSEPTAANTEFHVCFGVLCAGSLVKELFLELLGVDIVLVSMLLLDCVIRTSYSSHGFGNVNVRHRKCYWGFVQWWQIQMYQPGIQMMCYFDFGSVESKETDFGSGDLQQLDP